MSLKLFPGRSLHSLSSAMKDRRPQGKAINILQDLTEFGSLKTVELEIGFCLISGSRCADSCFRGHSQHSLSFAVKDRPPQGNAINILQHLTAFGSLKTMECEIGFCLISGSHCADRLSTSWMIQQHDE
ncbi:hypothetical protein CDAR_382251 [Caerostris darwini]|uniref:Uncharacterized protein n=1 Tax=Caerostris darwini TaxID=1538125 RepID=A0AAV4VY03_9ARAC|nr:hypothetical protein CDAR_382251 [Caerostris darwini]